MSFTPAETAACEHLARLALAEDLDGAGDLTSQAVIPSDRVGQAVFVARPAGVLAGLPAARIVFALVDPALSFEPLVEDGDAVPGMTRLAVVRGPMRSLLTGERTALNFMQRLSGIATLTARHVALVAGLPCKVLDTRKTTPGWRRLEKYAVRQGGGHNHRMGLYDGVLIKDNHLAALGPTTNAVAEAVRLARQKHGATVPLEIEVDTLEQLDAALAVAPDIVLLDNMPPEQMREAVRRRNSLSPGCFWRRREASLSRPSAPSRKVGSIASASARSPTPRRLWISGWTIFPRMRIEECGMGNVEQTGAFLGGGTQPAFPIREVWYLETRRIGRRVLVFDHVDSTNSLAASLAGQPGADGLALLADEQSAGRGQHGRHWLAPPRSSVLLSVLLYLPPELCRPAILTAWAAVAVCAVVRQTTGLAPRIKWPNDVLVHGKKICGILIEQSQQGGVPATVAGLGLNVAQSEEQLAAAGLPLATSLHACGAGTADAGNVARLLLTQLDEEYDRLCQGDHATLETSWKQHIGLVGQNVSAECTDGVRRGRLLEMGFDGILLDLVGGVPVMLAPESILHLTGA